MTMCETNPPLWAEATLRSLLPPSDRDDISGDLLEEYCLAQRPMRGATRANAWYTKQVLSVLWPLIQPYALLLATQSVILALTVFRPGHHAANSPQHVTPPLVLTVVVKGLWYGSAVGAPGVSLFDALIYFAVAYHGTRRSRLIRTGLLTAGAASVVAFTVLFSTAAAITPGLIVAAVTHPTLFLIAAAYLLVLLCFSALWGAVGAFAGRLASPKRRQATAS
jgi:hypothetical protein